MSEKKLHFWSLRVTASKWTMAVNVGRQISTVSCVLLSVLWALRDENSDLLLREQQSQLVIYKVQVKNKTNTWRVWLLITVCGFIQAAEVVKTVSSFFFCLADYEPENGPNTQNYECGNLKPQEAPVLCRGVRCMAEWCGAWGQTGWSSVSRRQLWAQDGRRKLSLPEHAAEVMENWF